MNHPDFISGLVAAASACYRPAGRYAWHFALGKLSGDPVFVGLLERGLIPEGTRLLDLGCGQGLLAAWLFAAQDHYNAGRWPPAWPPAPRLFAYRGIELMPPDAHRARSALGGNAEIVTGDIRTADLGKPWTVVILDVLQYITHADQEDLLARIHAVLPEDGTLLLRVGDAAGGLGFAVALWVDRCVALARGHGWTRFYCRALRDWEDLLRELGFSVESLPMHRGTPFPNTLLICRKLRPDAVPIESASGR